MDVVKEFESFIAEHEEEWGVKFYVCRLRSTRNNGDCDVYFEEETPIPQEEILANAKKDLPVLKGVRASIGWEGSGDRNTSFSLHLHGESTSTLEVLSRPHHSHGRKNQRRHQC